MHDTSVVLKDGREFCAPIWTWAPKDGYLELIGEDGPVRLHFRDMASAVTDGQRVNIHFTGRRDEIERARREGWDGT